MMDILKRMDIMINNKQLNDSTVTTAVAKNKAKGHVDVIGIKYKKKKKKSKLTGKPIVVHEGREMKEWNYIFRGTSKGAMSIKATSKEVALKKIKKEWGISSIPSNLFIWTDDDD